MAQIYKMEPTIKAQAKKLAGAFYEQNRSDKFRKAFPTVNHYLMGWQFMYNRDGSLQSDRAKKVEPGWTHHIALARTTLTLMLGQPDSRISPAMKERIYDAICEDRENTTTPGRKPHRIHQRKAS